MRTFLTILFFSVLSANAQTNYYVDSSKSDANNGLTPATAWKTLSKVNSYSLSTGFNPGDSILLNRGDSWNDTLRFHSSGTAVSPIVIGAYGTGNKPLITGFQQVPNASWIDSTGHIWKASVPNAAPQLNTVMIDGKLRAKGRYPNTGYMATYGYATTQWKIFNYSTPHLTQDYSGGQIVFREYGWIVDNPFIDSTRGTGDTMYLRTPLTYNIQNVGKYFIENTPKVLDTTYEWAYDSARTMLYVYSIDTPNVQISTIDTTVISRRKDFITFDNITVTGANAVGFNIDTSNHNIIQNSTIKNTGGWYTDITQFGSGAGGAAIRGQDAIALTINNDSLINNLNDGILAIHGCDSAKIINNYIDSTSALIGMSSQGNGSSMGMYAAGNYDSIYNNKILNSGYHGVYFYGLANYIHRNRIDTFDLIKEDGGGIYTASCTCTGTLIDSNIVSNGIGTFLAHPSSAIYLDNSSTNISVLSNTLYGSKIGNFFFNSGGTVVFKNNNIVTNSSYATSFAYPIGSSSEVKNNISYSTIRTAAIEHWAGSSASAYNIDSNYFFRSNAPDSIFLSGTTYSSLSSFQTATGYELHSHLMPSNYSNGILYYNDSFSDSTITVTSRKVDAKGTVYFTGTLITLHPFQSIILFDIPSTYPKEVGGFQFN